MKLFVTVLEGTLASARETIRGLIPDRDGIEIRVERFPALDLPAIRAATSEPILLTSRGRPLASEQLRAAIDAGIDLVDVEYGAGMIDVTPFRDRIVLSHHDFEGIGDLERIAAGMKTAGCAHTKLAVTPATFRENERLLTMLDDRPDGLTVIGMGERGLYSRILAPFRGSALAFVAADEIAAPGQLSHAGALEIYGSDRAHLLCEKLFAVVGNPAGHSRSPAIHNRLFRQSGLTAAYTIASVAQFEEITDAFLRGEPCGLSVTAPFKERALAFAEEVGAEIAENARQAGAVNTLVNYDGRIVADNTDVDGFQTLLGRIPNLQHVGIVGAGGTARAALVAARSLGVDPELFNRTTGRLGARPLAELTRWTGDVLIDTTPGGVELPLRTGLTVIQAAYGEGSGSSAAMREAGVILMGGVELLEAQALRQHELFARAFRVA